MKYHVGLDALGNGYNVSEYKKYVKDKIFVFNGRLADCEAYIRLKEGGYM